MNQEQFHALQDQFEKLLMDAETRSEMVEILADIILAMKDACFTAQECFGDVDSLNIYDGLKRCEDREIDSLIDEIHWLKGED